MLYPSAALPAGTDANTQPAGRARSPATRTPPDTPAAALRSTHSCPTLLGSTYIPGSRRATLLLPSPASPDVPELPRRRHSPTHLGRGSPAARSARRSSRLQQECARPVPPPPLQPSPEARPRAAPQGLPEVTFAWPAPRLLRGRAEARPRTAPGPPEVRDGPSATPPPSRTPAGKWPAAGGSAAAGVVRPSSPSPSLSPAAAPACSEAQVGTCQGAAGAARGDFGEGGTAPRVLRAAVEAPARPWSGRCTDAGPADAALATFKWPACPPGKAEGSSLLESSIRR